MFHSVVDNACYSFWSNAFQLPIKQLKSGDTIFVTSGSYVERAPERFYAFFDYLFQSRIFAGSPRQISAFQAAHTQEEIERFDATSICECSFFSKRKPLYNDLDHYIPNPNQFNQASKTCKFVELSNDVSLEEFYSDCSEDNVDTLDLDIETDIAIAGLVRERLVGIASYRIPSESQIADITVLVRQDSRGQGLSVPLVSALVNRIYLDDLVPHYRAGVHNFKSLSIARRLGFVLAQQIIVWDDIKT